MELRRTLKTTDVDKTVMQLTQELDALSTLITSKGCVIGFYTLIVAMMSSSASENTN